MKLRLHQNSLRLRLGPAEVKQLAHGKSIVERTRFGPESWQQLTYLVHSEMSLSRVLIEIRGSEIRGSEIRVSVPPAIIERWAASDEVAIEATQAIDSDHSLRLLIEKDFACLHGKESNDDVFPNPREGA